MIVYIFKNPTVVGVYIAMFIKYVSRLSCTVKYLTWHFEADSFLILHSSTCPNSFKLLWVILQLTPVS